MALTGDDITRLYQQHATRMVARMTRATFDVQAGFDIVGETFARAFEQRAKFSGDVNDKGAAWINGIADNLMRDYHRSGAIQRRAMEKLGVEQQLATDDDISRVADLAETAELRGRVADELERLGADTRGAVRLRVVEELDYPEIAAQLGLKEPAVRARVSRGLRELRDALEPDYRVEEVMGNV